MERGRSYNQFDNLWGPNMRDNPVLHSVGMPCTITGALTQEQQAAYQVMFRIQEITTKLRINDFKIPNIMNRSPSPPPIYDSRGRRTNTREQRFKKILEEERHRLVEIALKMIPHFVAPGDYKRPAKFQDKYFIPIHDFPQINFVGLLLGPRGNTLKQLQQESGCKIAIRGRGSVKEGKNSTDLPKGAMNMNEPLHCIISADTEEKIPLGIKVIERIIIKAVTSPEGQNDLKRGQLRELAVLNGTLREDNRPCPSCGLSDHKKWECPENGSLAQTVICQKCGESGHATRDCAQNINQQGKRFYVAEVEDSKTKRVDNKETNYNMDNLRVPSVAPGLTPGISSQLVPPLQMPIYNPSFFPPGMGEISSGVDSKQNLDNETEKNVPASINIMPHLDREFDGEKIRPPPPPPPPLGI